MCLVTLILGALSAVYCFIFCSGGLANIGISLGPKEEGKPNYDPVFRPAQELYVDAQGFNNALLIISIIMILVAALLYITSTNKRRNYYISNYVATGIVCTFNIVVSIVLMVMIGQYMSRFMGIINDPVLNAFYVAKAEANANVEYVSSTWNFALGFVVYTLVIIGSIGLILNLMWKVKLMKGEKELLAGKTVQEEVA